MLNNYTTALDVRRACRSGAFREPTAGFCPGFTQANLIVLPGKHAASFRTLCERNPVSCPLVGETRGKGDPRLQSVLGEDSDIRFDAPGYNVYRNGKLIHHDIANIEQYWQDDSVGFLIGCSFTFEQALCDAGLTPRHITNGANVPMYKTTYALLPAGVFEGEMVVSMRTYKKEQVERVREITRPYVKTHGEPVAWGFDALKHLGIRDLYAPEFGDTPAELLDDEVPVFWGCGVTPQQVIMSSSHVEGIVTAHAPGKMLCLDLPVAAVLRAT